MEEALQIDIIKELLHAGLEQGLITEDEVQNALKLTEVDPADWILLQPILDKAQGIEPVDPEEDEARLKQAREEHPLYRSDFTDAELEKLKTLAPEEYELLK